MRVHKYRFWDLDNKEWVDILQKDIVFRYDPESPTLWSIERIKNGKLNGKLNVATVNYTGLFDDRGEEICEGDIVYAFKKNSGLHGYYKVAWDSRRGRWAYMNGEILEKYQVGKAGNIRCKIFGNEFENPTLNDIRRKH